MIRYTLTCEAGHGFESWFRDSDAFDDQRKDGLVACPICESRDVAKSIMAPALVGRVGDPTPSSLRQDRRRIEAFRAAILESGEDLGARFASEARRIHDGEAPARLIHGRATSEEARDLLEDGIAILPVPPAPRRLD